MERDQEKFVTFTNLEIVMRLTQSEWNRLGRLESVGEELIYFAPESMPLFSPEIGYAVPKMFHGCNYIVIISSCLNCFVASHVL